ncbi:MAG: DUF2807 domain-containing protein [Bacteroidetes bacterium QH_2_63_10]|nr:MAG: DUF2807 domain-containing protein [Bacteroidetes bacterium QH_2_63_10]
MSSFPARLLRVTLLVGLLALPVHIASAQDQVRETRSVASFTGIEYAIPGTLHLQQGNGRSIELEAPKNVLDRVETTVEGETLEISDGEDSGVLARLFGDNGLDTDQVDVYVTAPMINRLSLAGRGHMEGESRIKSASLSLNVAGSGSMEIELDTKELSVQIAGSGACTLRGQADSTDADIAGSGDLRAADLTAQRTKVRIAGSGNAELNVVDRLSAEIFGSGDVRYRGRPEIETNTIGSGDVRPIE